MSFSTSRCTRTFAALIAAALLAAAAPAFCQDTSPAARIARYTDPQTIGVIRVDLERFDLAALGRPVGDVPLDAADRDRIQASVDQIQQAIDAWKELGARELFVIASLADSHAGGVFVVLPGAKAPDDGLPPLLHGLQQCERVGDALVCGPAASIERLKPAPRAEHSLPAAAFEAVKDFPLQLVVAPGDDQRRVLRELGPTLPAEWGGLDTRALADGAVWTALGAKPGDPFTARLVVQSQDTAAAGQLRRAIETTLTTLTRRPELPQFVPGIEGAVRSLTPAVEDDRLVLNISTENPLARLAVVQLQVLLAQEQRAARRQNSMHNLRQLALALHNFHDVHGGFPPTASYDAQGKPLLSWRVYVLPYVDAGPLYNQFRLNEPWDSEHNKQLIAKMPPAFASPHARAAVNPDADRVLGMTTYLAPVGEGTVFTGGKEGIGIRDITDGTSNTILLLEVPEDKAVIWTKPDDWPVDLDDPLKGLFPEGRESMPAVFADGAARFIPRTIDPQTLKALFTRAGGEPVGAF